jgi:hypothetical protein
LTVYLSGGINTAPQLLVPGQIQGGPGNYTIRFQGTSDQLSVPLLSVTGTDQPIQASADFQEVK